MNCKNCNAVMRVDKEKKMFVCPYCESVEPFNDFTNQELKEELKGIVSEAIRDANHNGAGNGTNRNTGYQDARSKSQKAKDLAITVMQIIFCVILGFFSIMIVVEDARVVGYISLTQLVLLITAMVNKSNYHHTGKEKMLKTAKICTISASLLIIAWVVAVAVSMNEDGSSSGGGSIIGSRKEVEWPAQGIGSDLPQLPGTLSSAYSSKDSFSATSKGISKDDFNEYVEACKKAGFTIDAEPEGNNYLAYDKDDNKLKVNYWEYSKELNIRLESGIQLTDFQWNESGLGGKVPIPKAEKSYTESFSKDSYKIYVGDVTRDDFVAYSQECINAGYEGYLDKEYYSGTLVVSENDKIHVRVEFQRGRLMYIYIYESSY